MSAAPTRAVLTIAVGKPVYLRYATNLARSFARWHPRRDIAFHLVTDASGPLERDLDFVRVHRVPAGAIGASFTSKLHMDRFAEADETLFVDADCLCVGHLGPAFDRFAGRHFSLVGACVSEGELFGDIAMRCRAIGVPWTIRFCGSLYYMRRGARCAEILAYARSLEPRYAELGLVPLRGTANEEPLIGLAMARYGEEPVPEDGSLKADVMFYGERPVVRVRAGEALLRGHAAVAHLFPGWRMPEVARPLLVHFNGGWTEDLPYLSESMRLRLTGLHGWPDWLADAAVFARLEAPLGGWQRLKDAARPLYRMLFGHRRVSGSERM